MKNWSEDDLLIGQVERAVTRYLYEDSERPANHLRYEIIRVDRFESPYENSSETIFAVAVRELFTLPQQGTLTRAMTLLATFQDGSCRIFEPIMSAHLMSL